MKQKITVTAIGTALLAVAAAAQPASATGGTNASAAGAAESAVAGATAKRAKPAKICLNISPDTGSRMARRSCRTQQEWEDQGVELTAKK